MLKACFDKSAVKRSFSRAASSYDRFADFQHEAAKEVSAALRDLLPEGGDGKGISVLDIGCGTGSLAELILSSLPEARVYGCDLALPMLCRAVEKLGQRLSGLAGADCEALPFRDSSFDCAASSLTYQWAGDLSSAMAEAYRVLKPGGLFALSTLGPETLSELRECYPGYRGLEFKDSDEILMETKRAGLEAISLDKRLVKKVYKDFFELLRTLKHIGASPPLERGKGLSPGRELKEAGEAYARKFPAKGQGVIASYELILITARKKNQ
ncbi:MAG: methyltransferase domain-containing protein [Deltaproteobacteria bacterium]|nr:methyltransferase domain-containing protein [Deltaproteobacteria bacterium]MBZ0219942.1 methyltransferase domain-containing protein [Deltaproteobacteria bacterium]